MIILDARNNADRPKPANNCEFKANDLWLNAGAPMPELKLNMATVEAHMALADADNVPCLFNFLEQSWEAITFTDFQSRLAWWTATWKQIRAVNPSQVVGVYAEVPASNYWAPVLEREYRLKPNDAYEKARYETQTKAQVKAAKTLNNKLHSLADAVSIICPSLYLYYPQHNDAQWSAFARWNIEEAKQYGKPVLPVVCPRFIDTLKPIDLDRWKTFIANIEKQNPEGLIVWDWSGHGPYSDVQSQFEALEVVANDA